MFARSKARVLVVGAGPAGLITALVLETRGIQVDIIDSGWRAGQRDNALMLQPRTFDVLDSLGLGGELVARSNRIGRIAFYNDGEHRAEFALTSGSSARPHLVVTQKFLEGCLAGQLRRKTGRSILWSHRLARLTPGAGGVDVAIERLEKESQGFALARMEWAVEKTVDANYEFVVGADGHDSRVRRLLDIPWEPLGPAETYAMYAVDSRVPTGSTLRILFNGPHGDVLWPLPGQRWQWAFHLPESRLHLTRLDKSRLSVNVISDAARQEFSELIAARAPWFDEWCGELEWSAAHRFERRVASYFGTERCGLVGDAAHVATPIDLHQGDLNLFEVSQFAAQVATALQTRTSMQGLRDYAKSEKHSWTDLFDLEKRLRADEKSRPWAREHVRHIARCLLAREGGVDPLARDLGLHQ